MTKLWFWAFSAPTRFFHSFSTAKRKWLHFLLGKAKDKQNGEKKSFQFVECDGQNLWKLINDTNQFCEKHCRSDLLLSFFSSSSVTFSLTKKTNALTGTFLFLLLHLLLFPSKGKKKNQTYLLSQTLKFLTNVTNHFCSLFSTNLVKQGSTKFLHFFGQKLWTQNNRFSKVFQNGLANFSERWN